MAAPLSLAAEVRKLRKKLRQIENLERLNRPLNSFEEDKVFKKHDIRDRLQFLLTQQDADGELVVGDMDSALSASDETQDSWQESGEHDDLQTKMVSATFSSSDADGWIDTADNSKPRTIQQKSKDQDGCDLSLSPKVEKKTQESQSDSDTQSLKRVRAQWRAATVQVSDLEGHSDLVTSVCVQGSTLVSGSRDTTVKVWDLMEEREVFSLGGHTETVTCVMILPPDCSEQLGEDEGAGAGDGIIVSGSTDCTFKYWSLQTGKMLKSVYTFNPVTCLGYSSTSRLVVTASDGGKLELWSLKNAENVFSTHAHQDSVSGVKVIGDTVYSACTGGYLMVHQVRDGRLVRVFVSEDVKMVGMGGVVTPRPVRSLEGTPQTIIYGEDAINIKLLDWKKVCNVPGMVRKLANHTKDFASTDALCLHGNLLLSSSYDLDKGNGYLNVRHYPSGDYVATLTDDYTERIISMACAEMTTGNVTVVTGGVQLTIWRVVFPGTSRREGGGGTEVSPQFLPSLAQPATPSDDESDDDTEEDDEEDDVSGRRDVVRDDESNSWLSWCSVL